MAVRLLVKRRVVQKMSEDCKQMPSHCKEMMEGRSETSRQEASAQKLREHCEELAARHREDAEPVRSRDSLKRTYEMPSAKLSPEEDEATRKVALSPNYFYWRS